MGFTYWEREGTGFPRNPMIVGYVVFSTKSKNQHTPLQSRGTLLRAFCAVRKQHTKQVTPVEGVNPIGENGFCVLPGYPRQYA
jgi:hypothetical protein